MQPIPRYDGYIFDLDGTIYLGDILLPGAAELLHTLRQEGRRITFLSNNPTKTRWQYAERLQRLGIAAEEHEIVTSAAVMVEWLLNNAPGAPLFVVGEAPLIGELEAAGFPLSERPGEIAFVVASIASVLCLVVVNLMQPRSLPPSKPVPIPAVRSSSVSPHRLWHVLLPI